MLQHIKYRYHRYMSFHFIDLYNKSNISIIEDWAFKNGMKHFNKACKILEA